MTRERDWRSYEQQIDERLRRMAGDAAEVKFDQRLRGHLSGVDRQVDVLVVGSFAGGITTATLAVDCKCWGRRVDVADVDRFVGTIEDIRTDFGLLVTTEGFTQAAKQRAANARGIQVDVVPYDELSDWEPPLEDCMACGGYLEPFPPVVYVAPFADETQPIGAEYAIGAGVCSRCDAVHMRCRCGTLNVAHARDHEQWRPCDSACGVEWKAHLQCSDEQELEPMLPHEQVAFRSAS